MPVLLNHYVMIQRNLKYKCITRAKKKMELQLEEKMERWEYLEELAAKIAAQ